MSSADPEDPREVITFSFYQGKTRLLAGHLHLDGSYKLSETRAGRRKSMLKEGIEQESSDNKNNGESSLCSNSGGSNNGSSSNITTTTDNSIHFQDGVPWWWDHKHNRWWQVYEDQHSPGRYYYIDENGASHWVG